MKNLSIWTLLGGVGVMVATWFGAKSAFLPDGDLAKPKPLRTTSATTLTPAQQRAADQTARELARLEGIGGQKFRVGDYAGAANIYRQALLIPGLENNPLLKQELARALQRMGPSEEALSALRDALRPHTSSLSEDPRSLTNYGEMALSLHHPDEAGQAFHRAIVAEKQPTSFLPRIDPKTKTLVELQASAHVACGFKDMYQTSNAAAEAQFARALALAPNWPAVQLYRAENLRRQGKREAASKEFRILTGSSDKEVATIAAKQLERCTKPPVGFKDPGRT